MVQETARKQVARMETGRAKALVEEVNGTDPTLLTGRLSNNILVHFPGDPSLIGRIVEVELTENRGFYFLGRQVVEP